MFPIFWRYTLQGFIRTFLLSVFCFLSVLIVSRFKLIARFAALSYDWGKTGLFILYQLPSILPMAIPISALLSALLLFQRLSQSGELTALRAAGLKIKTLLTPVLLTAGLLSILNFSIVASLSPLFRKESHALLYKETTQNPLIMLQRQQIVKVKNTYLKMRPKEEGRVAKDFFLVGYNDTNQRLSLIAAEQLWLDGQELFGKNLSWITHIPSKEEKAFDTLIIENQGLMATDASFLSHALKRARAQLESNSLNFKMLRVCSKYPTRQGRSAQTEIVRRISVSLGPFSLTLLGCAFGILSGRNPSRKNLLFTLGLTLLLLLSYFIGKEFKRTPILALFAFSLPHLFIWIASALQIRKIERGAA